MQNSHVNHVCIIQESTQCLLCVFSPSLLLEVILSHGMSSWILYHNAFVGQYIWAILGLFGWLIRIFSQLLVHMLWYGNI